jgi:hypothetical protein
MGDATWIPKGVGSVSARLRHFSPKKGWKPRAVGSGSCRFYNWSGFTLDFGRKVTGPVREGKKTEGSASLNYRSKASKEEKSMARRILSSSYANNISQE